MKNLIALLFVVGLIADIGCTAPKYFEVTDELAASNEPGSADYRLNDDVTPVNYEIELTPHFEERNFTFDGSVKITVNVKKAVDTITLHQDGLNIYKITVRKKNKSILEGNENIVSQTYDKKTNKLTIKLAKKLNVAYKYEILFTYTGTLRTDMNGFYRSSYKINGETKWLASTQMQPVHARKAFPCFDEPRFKATFNIVINRPSHFSATLSNTRLKKSISKGSMVQDTFEETPRMSTYLVAFIVSEFHCRENADKTFAVCARPNAFDQTEYSFDVGQKILKKFDERFGYEYKNHMNKMAMVAIPDFEAGAMENWGLLTYRETALLYDPEVSTSYAQQRVASVVAHEQAHMWFGDLVTCDWWSNTWLNEGHARFFEYFGTDAVESDWGLEDQFVVNQVQVALGVDSVESTEALFHEVNTPDEIANRFSSISYNKGGSVIRMFEHTFGRDNFIKAHHHYLETNALQTTVPEKLYLSFEKVIGHDKGVRSFMNSWVVNPGYPVLYVSVTSVEEVTSITLTQKRFLRNNPDHDDETLWTIPITYASNTENEDFSNTQTGKYLAEQKDVLRVKGPIEWIVFNVQQTGYYRVNYDSATWTSITNKLYKSHTDINTKNRAQIVDDSLNLARAHQLNYEQALQTIEYLKDEVEYIPWLSAFNNFEFILTRFKKEESSLFKNFILELLTTVYSHLGFHPKSTDTRLDIYNRNLILKYACKFGHQQCIADAKSEYEKFSWGAYKIPVDLVPVVYCTVVSEGSILEWKDLWNKFMNENVAAEQVAILTALGCAKHPKVLTLYLEKILTDDVRLQDKYSAFVNTLQHQENYDLVLDFMINNYEKMLEAFKSNKELKTIASVLVARSTNSKHIKKIEGLSDKYQLNLEVALKNAKSNLEWAEKHIPTIKKYLQGRHEAHSSNSNGATTNTISCFVLLTVALISFLNY